MNTNTVRTDMTKTDTAAEERLARQNAAKWLKQHGDPYTLSVLDLDGRVGIDYGVYGVPETYIIDKTGIIHAPPEPRRRLSGHQGRL